MVASIALIVAALVVKLAGRAAVADVMAGAAMLLLGAGVAQLRHRRPAVPPAYDGGGRGRGDRVTGVVLAVAAALCLGSALTFRLTEAVALATTLLVLGLSTGAWAMLRVSHGARH